MPSPIFVPFRTAAGNGRKRQKIVSRALIRNNR